MSAIDGYIVNAFDALTPNLNGIYENAATHSLSGWKTKQGALVTTSGVTGSAIPGLHMATVAADIAFLLNRMAVCSYGIGAIIGNEQSQGNILEEEDFAVILGRWCGDDGLSNAALSKGAAEIGIKAGGKIAGKVGAKAVAKFAVTHAGILVGKKMGVKMGAKLGSKFGAKLGGKITAGWLPFLGPALSGGINLYFITSISKEAESWYRFKLNL